MPNQWNVEIDNGFVSVHSDQFWLHVHKQKIDATGYMIITVNVTEISVKYVSDFYIMNIIVIYNCNNCEIIL